MKENFKRNKIHFSYCSKYIKIFFRTDLYSGNDIQYNKYIIYKYI